MKIYNTINYLLFLFEKKSLRLILNSRRIINKYAFWIKRKNYCLFCNSYSRLNLPYGILFTITKKYIKKGVPTAGLRLNSRCPNCGSLDRERFLYYALNKYTDIFNGRYKILHIAPEFLIEQKFRLINNSNYITGDLLSGKADLIVDLTNMKNQFNDNQFDFIICSHVLQDIADEKSAFEEMKRVLKNEGVLILSIPICSLINTTFECNKYKTPIQRLIYFGNRTHVRVYGNDITKRLDQHKLDYIEKKAIDILPLNKIKMNRFIPLDRIFFCQKNI